MVPIINIPFVFWPEMLNWPFFMNRGWLPYRDFAMIHTPILPALLLLNYKIFGFSLGSLQIFGTILLLFTAILVARISNSRFSAVVFLILAVSFEGYTVWFESLLAPILLTIYWLQLSYFKTHKDWKLLLMGILLGVSLLVKQTSLYIFPEILLFFWLARPSFKQLLLVLLSILSVLGVFVLILLKLEIINDFLFWGVKFVFLKPFESSKENSYVLLPNIKQALFIVSLLLVAYVGRFRKFKNQEICLMAFIFLTLFFAYPRFGYFHLVPTVAFLTVTLTGYRKLVVIFLALILLFQTQKYAHSFVEPNVMEIASEIKNNYLNATVFSLNGPDQVYFLSNKLPGVRPWVPQLPWYFGYYENEFSRDFLANPPDIIFMTPYRTKAVDGLGAYKPERVVGFVQKNYRIVKTMYDGTLILERK